MNSKKVWKKIYHNWNLKECAEELEERRVEMEKQLAKRRKAQQVRKQRGYK